METGERGGGWWTSCPGMRPGDRHNSLAFNWWLFGWMASWVGASIVFRQGLVASGVGVYAVALAPNLLGLFAVAAFVRFIREADELLRKIHLEGLAWGFGIGALFMVGYRLLERTGAPKLDISDGMVAMFVAYAVATIVAARRYS